MVYLFNLLCWLWFHNAQQPLFLRRGVFFIFNARWHPNQPQVSCFLWQPHICVEGDCPRFPQSHYLTIFPNHAHQISQESVCAMVLLSLLQSPLMSQLASPRTSPLLRPQLSNWAFDEAQFQAPAHFRAEDREKKRWTRRCRSGMRSSRSWSPRWPSLCRC